MADIREELAALETKLNALKTRDETPVMFSALVEHGGAYGPFNTQTAVVYNTEITNIGDAYNKCTGIFTAPVAGVYYFTFFYHAGGYNRAMLSLVKNCDIIVQASDHKSSSDGADNGGNAAFVQLDKGDQVFVRMEANTHVWASERRTSFSGFLVSQM